jgi:hypothetical protein
MRTQPSHSVFSGYLKAVWPKVFWRHEAALQTVCGLILNATDILGRAPSIYRALGPGSAENWLETVSKQLRSNCLQVPISVKTILKVFHTLGAGNLLGSTASVVINMSRVALQPFWLKRRVTMRLSLRCNMGDLLLVWLVASMPARNRVGIGRSELKHSDVFTKFVIGEISCIAEECRIAAVSARDLAHDLRDLDGKVVGCLLIRPLWCPSAMDFLSPVQRCIRDFWEHTRYAAHPLLFVQVVDRVLMDIR